MRRFTETLLAVLLLFPATLTAGGRNMPSAQLICDQIQRQIPGSRFEREGHLRLGRAALTLAKPILRLALDKDDETRAIVSNIKRVEIATYRVVELPAVVDAAVLSQLETQMNVSGWTTLVRSRDEDDNTWVFHRQSDNGRITGILVVELDQHDLSIVSVEGRLDEVLAHAIADDLGEFSALFGT